MVSRNGIEVGGKEVPELGEEPPDHLDHENSFRRASRSARSRSAPRGVPRRVVHAHGVRPGECRHGAGRVRGHPSRSDTGSPVKRAEERLAGRPEEQRQPEPVAQPAGVGDELQVVLQPLAESDAGIHHQLRGPDCPLPAPGSIETIRALGDLDEHIVITRLDPAWFPKAYRGYAPGSGAHRSRDATSAIHRDRGAARSRR